MFFNAIWYIKYVWNLRDIPQIHVYGEMHCIYVGPIELLLNYLLTITV